MTAHDLPVLSRQALNRATLARQGLLQRWRIPAVAAVERVVGLQAQAPIPPYYALWNRVADFCPADLGDALEARTVVRTSLHRGTIHLVTVDDALALRALLQPMLSRHFSAIASGKHLAGLDIPAVLAAGIALLRERPRTNAELGADLANQWPGWEPSSLAQIVQFLGPTVQIPPRGVWGKSGQATWAVADDWLGRSLDHEPSVEDLIRRYLAAFGPASVADAQKWSGLSGLAPAFAAMRPSLLAFLDESGRTLFDLPDAPRPDPSTPAPVRLLAEFDNVLLAYADRSRMVSAEDWPKIYTTNGIIKAVILVDGTVRGLWTLERTSRTATLVLRPFSNGLPLSPAVLAETEAEALNLLAFATPDADSRTVRIGE